MDDSGVVDDHDADGDVTSAEEHERREQQPRRKMIPQQATTTTTSTQRNKPHELPLAIRGQDYPPPTPVTVSVRTSNREIRVLKCNGIKSKKHLYSLPPEYLSHIVVLGKFDLSFTRRTDRWSSVYYVHCTSEFYCSRGGT